MFRALSRPIIRSSITAVAASGFTYFHKRYCIVNLQVERDRWYCFVKFTVTIGDLFELYNDARTYKP